MPDLVHDLPRETVALYFSMIAVASIVFGLLVVKPVLRILIGAGPDLKEAINYGTSGFSLF